MSFHNYLHLEKADLSLFDIVIFYGESGVGKSTYIHELRDEDDIVIDEIWRLSQCLFVGTKLEKGGTLFIASHLPAYCYFFNFLFFKVKFINLNKNKEKIQFALQRLGMIFSDQSIDVVMKNYRGAYLDLGII